jgi:septum site-determining protein MinC
MRLDITRSSLALFDLRRLTLFMKDEFGVDVVGLSCPAEALQRHAERELRLKIHLQAPVFPAEPARTEPARTEPARTEPARTEPARTEPARTEPPRPVEFNTPKLDLPKLDLPKLDLPKLDLPKLDSVRADSKLKAIEPDRAAPQRVTAEPTRLESSRPELPRLDLPRVEPVKLPEPPVLEPPVQPPAELSLQAEPTDEKKLPDPPKADIQKPEPPKAEKTGERVLLIDYTLRSGTVISFAGDIHVFGDVNPGAQVVAGGNVVVFGSLKGQAHAGTRNDAAFILAFDMRPTSLRIGRHQAAGNRNPNQSGAFSPEIAWVSQETIIIDPFKGRLPISLNSAAASIATSNHSGSLASNPVGTQQASGVGKTGGFI